MIKVLKITKPCPNCKTQVVIPFSEKDLGKTKRINCQRCKSPINVPISTSWANRFLSDPTMVDDDPGEWILVLEVLPNKFTEFQSFELNCDSCTIGRKNNSGAEHCPDVAILTDDMRMSRKHIVVRKRKGGFTLTDISRNGIVLSGNKMDKDDELYLEDGDVISLGETQLRVNVTVKPE